MQNLGQQMAALLARGGARIEAYPEDVRRLAEALSRIHGDVDVTTESHGIHLYMADPGLLMTDGIKELRSKHLAINASKYFGLGEWEKLTPKARDKVGNCMKDQHVIYRVSDLLNMRPLAARDIPNAGPGRVRISSSTAVMIQDEHGNTIPDHPGTVVPVVDLPDDHPAVFYLKWRGYDLELLWKMFRASWCEEEAPEIRGRRGYMRLVDGWMNTPQGRIIFYGDVRGVQTLWQGRMLEYVDETGLCHFVFHPYRRQWVQDAWRLSPTVPWQWLAPYNTLDDQGTLIWKSLAKYYNARGGSRTACGFDAAVAWNRSRRRQSRFAVAVEGPLDAGRIGQPAIAIVGKFMSQMQAELLASEFQWVLLGYDNDEAGRSQREKATAVLGAAGVRVQAVYASASVNDWGEMSRPDCWRALFPAISNIG
jgi:hypothetical protein